MRLKTDVTYRQATPFVRLNRPPDDFLTRFEGSPPFLSPHLTPHLSLFPSTHTPHFSHFVSLPQRLKIVCTS
jgi:hypothetical protein